MEEKDRFPRHLSQEEIQRDLLQEIESIERWFEHAETVGQTRLYSFLTASTILFAACGTLFSSFDTTRSRFLIFVFASVGFAMSVMWFGFGGRQAKLHYHLEQRLTELFAQADEKTTRKSPLFFVGRIKRDMNLLTPLESMMASRIFLYTVPAMFAFAFLIIAFAVFVA